MEPQDIAGGRYRVEAVLGRGGTATVYRVQDTILDVPRAVKVLSGSVQVRRALRRRLYAEAKAMARLDHPNILRLYDIGLDGDRDYVVMELAEGGTLGQLLGRKGPLPPYEALQFTLQILSALAVAHDHGIVHRDVKPENVLLNNTGTALLADFGIALLAEDSSRATRVGVTMGSLAYMPPEQRIDARSVGATADVYSVGATLYNLLTDENPIDLFTATESSARWDGIPAPLLALLRKATDINIEDRYSDAREMARAVLALLDDIGVDTPPLRVRQAEPIPSEPIPSDETFLIPEKKLSIDKPSRNATDAAIEFLTAVPTSADINPTLAPDDITSERPTPAPLRASLIAAAILAAGVLIAAAIALPGLLKTDGPETTPIVDVIPEMPPVTPTTLPEEPIAVEDPPPEEPPEEPIVTEPIVTEPIVETPPEEPVVTKPPPEPEEPVAVVEAPPEDTPSTTTGVTGSWAGSFNGRVMDVKLSGSSSQLSGNITVSFGSNSARTPVRGRFDSSSGMLYLTAYDNNEAIAKYELALSEDGRRLL
ncbi:MAG: serine/threonine protein kinase, partial [Myxococcota bacterium]